ncbi:MAG TPA: insulinase family protein [Caulobacteraceae bacterium]
MTFKPTLAAFVAGFALSLAGSPPPTAMAQTAAAAVHPWPQASSDIPADPNVRFGMLPNGMRYAIQRNATPPGQASLRLRIDAGAQMETDAQQGLAHYLEHMTFNGSQHVPEGEMIKILQRHGLSFGADTNAQTSETQTIYQLDLPQTDQDTLDTGLMLLREGADKLLLDPGAIDRERGVILSEERSRDTPQLHVYKSALGFFLKDQLASRRMPIGQVSVIRSADHDLIADFYRKYYRPERAVLIAVGDFDPAAMEAKIKAEFSDWKGQGPAGTDPDLGAPETRGPQTKLVVEPGAPLNIQVEWMKPHDSSRDSQAKRDRKQIEQLGLQVLNRRLQRLSRADNPPFISAQAFQGDDLDSAQVSELYVSAQPGKWKPALDAADAEVRSIVRYGVTQAELDREIAEWRVLLQTAAAQAATRKTPQIANEIAQTLEDDDVVTSPAEDLALFTREVNGLKAGAVNAALKTVFSGSGPLVLMSGPDPVEGGDATLAQAFQTAEAAPVKPPEAELAKAWPYDHFGASGKVAGQKTISDLGVTLVRFANGVRLTVKPTKFRDNEVMVRVRIGHGLLDLPQDHVTPVWAARGAFTEGGLKALSDEQLEQILASKIYGAEFQTGEDAFVLQGATRPGDLPTQMQVLAAYVSAPGYRPEAFQRMRTYYATVEDQLGATPSGVMSRDLSRLMHGGDPRFAFPTPQDVASSTPEDFRAALQTPVSGGPIDVIIVGDIPLEKAIALTASTFGALPPRTGDAVAPAALSVAMPHAAPEPVVLHHKGRADQSIAYAAWPTDDFFSNPQRARTLRVLAGVVENRLLDDLREAAGVTYSPQASATASLTFPHYGYLAAEVEIPPAKISAFYDDLAKISASLRADDVSADELARAKKPLIDDLEKSRASNEYWLEQLSGAYEEPRRFDAIRGVVGSLQAVDAAQIKQAAQLYLRDNAEFKLQIVPEAGAAVAP